MARKKDKDFDFAGEFDATPETAETHEVAEKAETEARQTYPLKDGTEGSRAAFIRELFLEDNMSRKEIAEAHDFPYRIVYSATVNLVNEAEAAGRGRTAANPNIKVHGADKHLAIESNGEYIDAITGEVVKSADLEDCLRNDWIKEKVEGGLSRGDIAKMLDLSYGVVYNLTKDAAGTRAKYEIELEDGTVVSRSAYIRQLFAEGSARSEIAKMLEVPYSVVWQATKVEKTEVEKFAELVEQMKAFEAMAENKALFGSVMADLDKVVIMGPEAEEIDAE